MHSCANAETDGDESISNDELTAATTGGGTEPLALGHEDASAIDGLNLAARQAGPLDAAAATPNTIAADTTYAGG